MNWYEFDLEPRDLFFFRDARPMDGAQIGHGASWPLPSVWHQALLTAFHERWPNELGWEQRLKKKGAGSGRFHSLVTCGLFPRLNDQLLVPRPADIGPAKTL
ncbi:MAG: type III-B CRISPR module-associated Cmr3 family protein, partial [Lentisphaerota bacterium]